VLRVPVVQTDEELAIALLETRDVYVHPGHFFDFAGEGYLVVSLIAREPEFACGIEKVLAAF
jgi:aspartate/methionine/tyrosine aminotransferase